MNETTTETTTEPATAADREALRAELQATHTQYRDLVAEIGEEHWRTRSGNPAWTCGQIAWHLAASPSFIAGQIEGARKGKSTNPPSFLMGMLFKASELRVKFMSRNATPQSVLADYDVGVTRMLGVLDATREDEFAVSKTNFGQTRTIAELFHVPAEHFAEHAPEVRTGIGVAPTGPGPQA